MLVSSVFLVALPLVALAGNQHHRSARHNRHRDVAHHLQNRANNYTLADKYQGKDFLSAWSFYDQADPTHGQVQFLSQSDAQAAGLAAVQSDGTFLMAVDDTTLLPSGANRKSVRISSTKTYDNGLIIADLVSMPHGCSVWPAWWMVGANWPNNGEIDVLEGVHNQPTNQYTLHTGSGCTLDKTPAAATKNVTTGALQAFSSTVLGETCESSDGSNDGCGFLDTDTRSYGAGFNSAGGGVYATLIDSTGVSAWFFSRDDVPCDIDSASPNPAGWGVPAAFWSAATCDPSTHFKGLSLTFDITLCGDWAGATYPSSCPGTCASAVMDPANFQDAKWEVNYVSVYQQ